MRSRILTGWTLTRIFQLVIGGVIIVQSIYEKQLLGILPGSYFFAMGIFGFGCASGNCSVPSRKKSNTVILDVEFEEFKTK
jgi:hypothetical protein